MSPSNYTRPAKNGKPGDQCKSHNSTLSSQVSFSTEENDKLLDWIDSLKSRVDTTFDKQKQEHDQLVQESNQEKIRQQYRSQISSAAFDKLGQFLSTPLQKREDRYQGDRYTNDRYANDKYHDKRYSNENGDSDKESEGFDIVDQEIDMDGPIDSAQESVGSGAEDRSEAQDSESPEVYGGEGEASDDAIEILSDESEPETKPIVSMDSLRNRPRLNDYNTPAGKKYIEEDSFEDEIEEGFGEEDEIQEGFGDEAEVIDYSNEEFEAEDFGDEDLEAEESVNEDLEAEESADEESEKDEFGHHEQTDLPDVVEEYQHSEAEASQSQSHEVFADQNTFEERLSPEENGLGKELDSLVASQYLVQEALARYSENASNTGLAEEIEDIEEIIEDVESTTKMEEQNELANEYYHAVEEESGEGEVFHETEPFEKVAQQPVELANDNVSMVSVEESSGIAESFISAADIMENDENLENGNNFYSVLAHEVLKEDSHDSDSLDQSLSAALPQPTEMTSTPIHVDMVNTDSPDSDADELMRDIEENEVEDIAVDNTADISSNKSVSSEQNLTTELIYKPPTPVFRSISAEDPFDTLKTLREAEKKYKIKLDSVRDLKSELNLPSESSEAESISEGESHAAEPSAFFGSKPEVPILEDISDSTEVESSDDESTAIYVDEPITKEETLVLYDEYTEFAPGISLHPSSIEEPEQTSRSHTTVTSIFKFVEDSDDEPMVKPTEVLEPSEPPEDVVVETMEETTEVIVPSHIEEFEELLSKSSTEPIGTEESRKRSAEVDDNPSPLKRIKKIFSTLNPFSWSKSEKHEVSEPTDNSDDYSAAPSDQEVEEAISEEITELIAEELSKVETSDLESEHSEESEVSEDEIQDSDDVSRQDTLSALSKPLTDAVEYVDEVVDIPAEPVQEKDVSHESGSESATIIKQMVDASKDATEYIEAVVDEPVEDMKVMEGPVEEAKVVEDAVMVEEDAEMFEDTNGPDVNQENDLPITSKIGNSVSAQKEVLETAIESASEVMDKINDVIQEPVDEKTFADTIRKERAQRLRAVVEGLDQKPALTQDTEDDLSLANALHPVADAVDYIEDVIGEPVENSSDDQVESHDSDNFPLAEAASSVVEKIQEVVEEPASTVSAKQGDEQSESPSGESPSGELHEAGSEESQSTLDVASKVLEHFNEARDAVLDSPKEIEQEVHVEDSPMAEADDNEQFSDALGPAAAVFEYIESAVEAPAQVSEDEYEHEEHKEHKENENEVIGGDSESNGFTPSVSDAVQELVNVVQDTVEEQAEEPMECDEKPVETEEIQTQEKGLELNLPKDPFVAVAETLDYVGEKLGDAVQNLVEEARASEENTETQYKAALDQAVETPIQSALGHISSGPQGTLEPMKDVVECIETNVEAPTEEKELGNESVQENESIPAEDTKSVSTEKNSPAAGENIPTEVNSPSEDELASEGRIRQFRQEKLQDFANSLKVPVGKRSSWQNVVSPLTSFLTKSSKAGETDLNEGMEIDEPEHMEGNSEQESEHASGISKSPRRSGRIKKKSTKATKQILELFRERADKVLSKKLKDVSSKAETEQKENENEENENEETGETGETEETEENEENKENKENEGQINEEETKESGDNTQLETHQSDHDDEESEGEGDSESASESDQIDEDPDESFAPNMSETDIDYPEAAVNETTRVTRSGRYLRSMGPVPEETDHIPIPKKEYGHSGEDTSPQVKQENQENQEVHGEKNESSDKNQSTEKTNLNEKHESIDKSEPTKKHESTDRNDTSNQKEPSHQKEPTEVDPTAEKRTEEPTEKSDKGKPTETSEETGKAAQVKTEESSPVKKPRRTPRNVGARYRRQVSTSQGFESPAFRTRSKSPIKRSIQELTSTVEGEPPRKRGRARPRRHKVTPEEEHEVNTRGRRRSRD